MLGPILTSILSKRELLNAILDHVIVELEQKAKACSGDEDMSRFERDVVPRHTAFRNATRCQVLLDGKVRELHHCRAFHIYYGNQA